MESKVLQGEAQGGLSELARRQEEVLRSQQQQLQRQRSKDAVKLRQIADMEEAALMAQGKYSSLQARACCLLALLLPFGLPTHSLLLPFRLPIHAPCCCPLACLHTQCCWQKGHCGQQRAAIGSTYKICGLLAIKQT